MGWVGLGVFLSNTLIFGRLTKVSGWPKKVVHFSTRHIFGTDHQNVPIVSASFPETLNILVKSVSFCLERFQRYGVLKNVRLFLDHPVVKCVHLGIDSVENLVANR